MGLRRIGVAGFLAATVFAVVPAGARASLSCAHSGSTIAADSQSRVFRRGTVTSGETKGAALYYGCSLRSGHIRRLNRRGDFGLNRVTGSTIRLAGPFVGYVENDVEALGVLPFAIVIDVRVVSHSAAIAPHSLALAANSHAIYWTEAGAARTAPIR